MESANAGAPVNPLKSKSTKAKLRNRDKDVAAAKRRCVSTACIACRKRKSKCDGSIPSCAACASVYGTECIYDPNSDHRRKGVYKKDIDNLKTRNSTLQTLIEAILNYPEHEVLELVKQIRTCESLDDVAEEIMAKDAALEEEAESFEMLSQDGGTPGTFSIETELSGKMGELRLGNGSVQFIGGTSNLLYLESDQQTDNHVLIVEPEARYTREEDAIVSWTTVTKDHELILHLIEMYFTWHYTYFTTLSKSLFFRDFLRGKPMETAKRNNVHCTSLLVNAILTLGCHFTSWPTARSYPDNPATVGDHFFRAAKRILFEEDEHEDPRLPTVQALALMSVREAGCGREAKGWVYSGMSFRMACDLGLNVDSGRANLDEDEVDARRITFWGCFLFDKCWSNYLGRPPQLPPSNVTTPKFDVFPEEDATLWLPRTDLGFGQVHVQPSRTRAVARQISLLCEISSDLLFSFYQPAHKERPQGKLAEFKKLSELHTGLEAWRKNLPKEMEPREGQLPNVLVMHMFFQLLYIHLFRPFLKHNQATSPFPAHVSPRKLCTNAAAMISKLLRLYKRTYGLRQICNIAVYIAHSACTIHLLNLPDKDARRDIVHGVRQLEEISDSWLCASRTLSILSLQARRWNIDLPEEAVVVLARNGARANAIKARDLQSPDAGAKSPETTSQASIFSDKNDRSSPLMNAGEGLSKFASFSDARATSSSQFAPNTNASNVPIQTATEQSSRPPLQYFSSSDIRESTWTPVRPLSVSQQSEASPSTLFGTAAPAFEDSRDWWLRDQSMLFDSWTASDPAAGLVSNGFGMGTGNTINNVENHGNINARFGGRNIGYDAESYGFESGNMY